MQLYAVIGEQICAQGEKAFVVHLAEALATQFPQRKGFSPRNLRRMRDFYHLYENSPSLMAQAMELGWTQNTMILECCEPTSNVLFICALRRKNNSPSWRLPRQLRKTSLKHRCKRAQPHCPSLLAILLPMRL
jgi:hypothetical protein